MTLGKAASAEAVAVEGFRFVTQKLRLGPRPSPTEVKTIKFR